MKLSIIICIYNTRIEYAEECLSSILASTLDDYEVLIVDDGSTVDYSLLFSRYPVRVIRQENRGLLAARLFGIGEARGEYITFVDSDDAVSRNFHRPMLMAAERYGADIVLGPLALYTEKTRRCCIRDAVLSGDIDVAGEDALRFYTSGGGRDHSVYIQCNKLFRRDLLLKTKAALEGTDAPIRRITFGEDALLNFFNYKYASRIISVTSGFYYYRMHGEQSIVAATEEKLVGNIDTMTYVLDMMTDNVGDDKHRDEVIAGIGRWRELMSRTHYAAARAGSYVGLYSYIKEGYGVDKLRLPMLADSTVYADCELLGDNYDEIDRALTEIFYNGGEISVVYERNCRHIAHILDTVNRLSDTRVKQASRGGDITVPKRKISFFARLVHNGLVYRLGMLLFKKGSRLRALLKKKL